MDKPWKVIFAFVGVFIAGAVFGGVFSLRAKRFRVEPQVILQPAPGPSADAGRTPPPTPPPTPNVAQIRQLTQRLNLTADQQKKLRPILTNANNEVAQLRKDTVRVQEKMYEEIAAILTDTQKGDLEEMRRNLQEKFEQERKKRMDQQAVEAAAKKKGGRPSS